MMTWPTVFTIIAVLCIAGYPFAAWWDRYR